MSSVMACQLVSVILTWTDTRRRELKVCPQERGCFFFSFFFNIPTFENSSSKSSTYQMSLCNSCLFVSFLSLLTRNCSHLSCLIVLTRLAFLSLLPRLFLRTCSGMLGIHISKHTLQHIRFKAEKLKEQAWRGCRKEVRGCRCSC